MESSNIETRLTRVEEKAKGNSRRIETLEQGREEDRREWLGNINKMTTAIEVLATEQRNTSRSVGSLADDVKAMQIAPAKRAEKVKMEVIKAVIATVIGAILGAVLALIINGTLT